MTLGRDTGRKVVQRETNLVENTATAQDNTHSRERAGERLCISFPLSLLAPVAAFYWQNPAKSHEGNLDNGFFQPWEHRA
jgi:hypothetical protein